MPIYRPGRHELGQNFLIDKTVIGRIVELVKDRPGRLVEWGSGNGALTVALAQLRRPLEGIEMDTKRAERLGRRLGPHVCITEGDILRHAPPHGSVVVSNVPFHLTTAILRHLLASPGWRGAVLITQWEVARKRAGVGGTTQLTAQWWPWFEFSLDGRIPATAFRPRPGVDAGLLTIDRRAEPLVADGERGDYQSWVADVFHGRGRGLREILQRSGVPPVLAADLARKTKVSRTALPRDLDAPAWATAYASRRPRRHRRRNRGRGAKGVTER